jgi:5,5'-dehydrodivanillate O-demethylase
MDKHENERLTRVGPGTPMGNLLRRYWWPIWFSEQVANKPVPVRLLGEDLVLFRDKSGKLGLLERYCAHRRVSLAVGRVEENCIRCCYHGWAFDHTGQCVDQPVEPEGSTLKNDVKLRAYGVHEASGLIFAYLGPDPAPVFPQYDLMLHDQGLTVAAADEEHCNWLQRAENTVDQHHLCVLHATAYPDLLFKHIDVDWIRAWYGLRITVDIPGRKTKIDHFIFPSANRFTRARKGDVPSHDLRIRVPIDDTLTRTFWLRTFPTITDQGSLRTEGLKPTQRGVYEQADDEWWGVASRDQDRMAQENQGPITDRSQEYLGWTDRGIVIYRNMLREALQAIEEGRDPVGIIRDPAKSIVMFDAAMQEIGTLTPAS